MADGGAGVGSTGGRAPSRSVVRLIEASDAAQLGEFFERLAADPASAHFHPHELTAEYADHLCSTVALGQDEYMVATIGEAVVGYAMLRGWDEGYATPAFGVAVDAAHRGEGLGRALLEFALECARERGASDVMLKVHPDNAGAKHLYESVGFTFNGLAEDGVQLRGVLVLGGRAE